MIRHHLWVAHILHSCSHNPPPESNHRQCWQMTIQQQPRHSHHLLRLTELHWHRKKLKNAQVILALSVELAVTIHTFFSTFLLLPFAALHPYPSPNQTPPFSFSYPSPTPAPASHNVSLLSPIQHQNLMMCCQGCNFVLHHPLSCSKE